MVRTQTASTEVNPLKDCIWHGVWCFEAGMKALKWEFHRISTRDVRFHTCLELLRAICHSWYHLISMNGETTPSPISPRWRGWAQKHVVLKESLINNERALSWRYRMMMHNNIYIYNINILGNYMIELHAFRRLASGYWNQYDQGRERHVSRGMGSLAKSGLIHLFQHFKPPGFSNFSQDPSTHVKWVWIKRAWKNLWNLSFVLLK